jgi:hypothetical protein
MKLIKLFEQFIREETEMAGNPAKEALADLIDDITSDMTLDPYRDADDLMEIYNKLLPYKGKTVGPPAIPRYKEMDSVEAGNMPALTYFNRMYGQQQNNQYGMGNPFNFADRINQVGNTSLSGGEERTSDGKYTTPQVKKMIIDLVTAK